MDWYFGLKMETYRAGKKVKKERNVGIRNSVFSVCSFAHLLCVHTIFEDYFDIPFFFEDNIIITA